MLSWFDSATKSQAVSPVALLFQTSMNTQDPEKRLNDRMADGLVSALIQRFPEVLDRYPMCPYVTRMRECLLVLGISKAQVVAWSSELQQAVTLKSQLGFDEPRADEAAERNGGEASTVECGDQRTMDPSVDTNPVTKDVYPEQNAAKTSSCGSKAPPKSPQAIWFEWYIKTPKPWEMCESRQKKFTYKQITNYTKLFLPNGFALDSTSETYSDDVMCIGQEAETNLYKFFADHGVTRKHGSSVLKVLRELHRAGKLDLKVKAYYVRVNAGTIRDPAPSHLNQILAIRG
ncbi:unnamed protein product [Phytophthora fragariaefolia]|uniref:Unnamed protein product n=1 Tax=Phytophthora fragariaefolia TaxID=1490495 RepID=A0A9W6XWV1_9STRA|nr:unnamed protein product [Phytophthora fragariaefolia]